MINHVRRRGRPRDPAVDARILSVAAHAIRERGYSGIKITELARRAGVSAPAIYRRWPSRAHLAMDLVMASARVVAPDTGDIRRDLIDWVTGRIRLFRDAMYVEVVLALCAQAAIDPEIQTRVRVLFQEAQEPMLDRLRAAVARRELAAGVDVKMVLNLAIGAVTLPLFFAQGPPDESQAEAIVDRLFSGLSGADRNAPALRR